MKLRHALLLPLLLLVSACAAKDPYPFPPQFVGNEDLSPRVIGAPPAQYSDTYTKEINSIIERQKHLTDADKAAIAAEDHISPRMIVEPVLGKDYTEKTNPALFTLLNHAASDAWRIGDTMQEYWHRTRPWIADNRVEILVSTIKRPSYPSGHSTTNHVWAHVLSELFPEKQEALYARAYEIGMDRSAAGVHYPSDVEAGKNLAAFIYAKMEANPEFQKELAAARAELEAPVAANDNTPLPEGKVCNEQQPNSMVMCH